MKYLKWVFMLIKRLFHTIKFLKARQIYYRLYYFIRGRIKKILNIKYLFIKKSNSVKIKLKDTINIDDCYLKSNEFKFLNLSKKFKKKIDWNYNKHGKLWTYNLTYFDFLSQQDSIELLFLIENFIENIEEINDGLESFPISLRGINWIKYLSYKKIKNQKIDDSLYAQYYILLDNLEYHLLGNHLLENGFSLLFGAYYFQDEKLYNRAKEILLEQLDEQILNDGGHFELSPMYHQIMLFRVLDCINLLKNSIWQNRELLKFLTIKAEKMLGWLKAISYKNGDIPLLNDSTNGIAPTTEQLFKYSQDLNLKIPNPKLLDSGYRKINQDRYECIVDIGEIGAKYIAGHAHADTFNFELRIDGKPFIVDTGLSTYEISNRRDIERSTASHNTVEVEGKNQSEVWGGFRVGDRANIVDLKESKNTIEATHNGYGDILHTRQWIFKKETIVIIDNLSHKSKAIAQLHFHPDITKEDILNHIVTDSDNMEFGEYYYASNFNITTKAIMVSIYFDNSLEIKIKIL